MSENTNRNPVRVRIAPSPTGEPHVGTAYIGLFNKVYARASSGTFILRIEDTDRERSRAESEQAIMECLKWLGLDWDEGPGVGGACGPYRQSERRHMYKQYAELLLESGKAYRCFCTKDDVAAMRERQRKEKLPPRHDARCRESDATKARRRADAGEPFVVRLKVPFDGVTCFTDGVRRQVIEFENIEIDDQVLLKSDGWPTYHLASVVDDHEIGITDFIRAEEWISSTPKHVLLYEAFGWEPPRFFHMPLLRNPDKSKISKRKNPTSLEWYRAQGYLPEALLNFLGLLGYSMPEEREKFTFDEMVKEFTWDRVKTSMPVFDLQKLDWLNGEYIREMPAQALAVRIQDEGFVSDPGKLDTLGSIMPHIQVRLKKLSEFEPMTAYFFSDELTYDYSLLVPKKKDIQGTLAVLRGTRERLRELASWDANAIETVVRAFTEETGWKVRDLFMPLRVAITGTIVSPPLCESMEVIGKERSLARIDAAIGKLSAAAAQA